MPPRCIGPSPYSPLRAVHPPRSVAVPLEDRGTVVAAYTVLVIGGFLVGMFVGVLL